MAELRRPQRHPSRIGSILVAVGCLGILGLTFGAGVYAGRFWARGSLPGPGPEMASAVAGAPPARRGASVGQAAPALTFYEELTAPLVTSPPPATAPPLAKVASAEPRRAPEKTDASATRAAERTAKNDTRGAEASARRSEPAVQGPRFTVQVAAYSARASAEALRNTIGASGHEAYIVESEGPPGAPRYRVRVGSYPSREAALAAAARLPVPGPRYVTTR